MKDVVFTYTIEEDDIKAQLKILEFSMIGSVIENTPYEKQMDSYVARTRCDQSLLMEQSCYTEATVECSNEEGFSMDSMSP
ncbi:hypothetical protein H5410_001833 [Solanum commersonii]|uniref:Uncharacterized protein n=1 Tax=Solanum commersonii TaxID=4109 RepID=A0A9J6B0A6_SOLCO|nr:hypothetical protein H5410_001833 [Solanum commersonii]